MELQVRDARVTDVDRISTLLVRVREPRGAGFDPSVVGDLLRQLVYLPNATVVVALRDREVVGVAILALRPSVRHGGLVGTIDLLAVDPTLEESGLRGILLTEVLRSARNKGCVQVEVEPAPGDADQGPWKGWGFRKGRARMAVDVVVGAAR